MVNSLSCSNFLSFRKQLCAMAQHKKTIGMRQGLGRAGSRNQSYRERQSRSSEQDDDSRQLIYGLHSVAAALSNPERQTDELYLTLNAENRLPDTVDLKRWAPQRVTPKDLDKRLGSDTVHQGALAVCQPLPELSLSSVINEAKQSGLPILVLDQITDPHNVGAVLRSAAVFGTAGMVMTRRHSPPLAGALAKSASGALETVKICMVQNLVRSLSEIAESAIPIVGLDSEADAQLEEALQKHPIAIVLGAEGKGLRQSTRETCNQIARISTEGAIASLNVSNAAAIALHLHAGFRTGRLQTP